VTTGRIAALWRYPVKSMLGEQFETAAVGEHGIEGDRSFALIDVETGKVCSAKRYDLWGGLFAFRSALERPGLARITFPDGSERTTEDPELSDALSDVLGRPVRLSSTAPPDATIEEIWDESKGTRMYGPRVGEHDGDPVIDVMASFAAPGDFFDFSAIHLLTTNTLAELGRLEPGSRFDVRRFRPNIVVAVDDEQGFVENDWTVVRIGDVELTTLMRVPRCVMTTLPQDDLPKDTNVLRSTAKHNMVEAGPLGKMPCAGIYSAVTSSGTLRVGDAVEIT
jgi:MOSC domain-containing protein